MEKRRRFCHRVVEGSLNVVEGFLDVDGGSLNVEEGLLNVIESFSTRPSHSFSESWRIALSWRGRRAA